MCVCVCVCDLFKKVDAGDGSVGLQHVQGAQLGRLGPPREPRHVEGDGPQEVVLKRGGVYFRRYIFGGIFLAVYFPGGIFFLGYIFYFFLVR